MEERILLNENEVLITSKRLAFNDEMYVLNLLESVKVTEGKKGNNIGFILLGVTLMVFGFITNTVVYRQNLRFIFSCFIFAGLVIFLAAIVHLIFYKPEHRVELTFASGDTRNIENQDINFIQRVVKALNDVIIFRE
ncbi:hypothetical protein Back11_38260 [Paenibacillus baekrokdamisoli]|uniref:Uncharacterized protein n=2 Tax=Paenibacillus baekrokdamisoli TaxID=1712516 RepID=A0A3G9J9F6_9BACL|nr:DUF6232 family protein [Paenibacillus baekrokdamisoli]MBB3068477.1 hypothetical protein [Paenibacillus baekrokdamisoli]BBH22481.1 hypothetical protein Back11_38260 [Paenibacillus baekrokdamisoli]